MSSTDSEMDWCRTKMMWNLNLDAAFVRESRDGRGWHGSECCAGSLIIKSEAGVWSQVL